MKSKISVLSTSAFMLVMMPLMANAAGIGDFLNKVNGWLKMLVPMMITLGIIAFFWGLAQYLFSDGENKEAGLKRMMMGILAVFVMASIGGLVALLQETTGTKGGNQITGPCVGSGCQTLSNQEKSKWFRAGQNVGR